jgi:ABC-type glycerol-3-phosphate transport system substrate-binding protein
MKKKRVMALFVASVMTMSMLAGCGNDSQESKQEDSAPESKEETGGEEAADSEESGSEEGSGASDVIAFEDIEFPDDLPTNPTLADQSWYDYDDMSVHYDLEFLTDHYGEEPPAQDPIAAWVSEKFNVTVTLTTCASADMENILSTRFTSGDVPDMFQLPSADFGFTLGGQGLLLDAREMYPYMPQTCKFVTKTMLKYSTMDDGTIPFTTKYAIQDSDTWALALRQDWLDNLGMSMPTTLDEIKEFARACTFDDPDQNGQDDTWFMTGAGGGTSFGCLRGFETWFGNPAAHEENGVLVHPMLDGSTRDWVAFMHELNDMKVLAPDWFTIEWETAKSYMLQDKVGMLRYPPTNLFAEYINAQNADYAKAEAWSYLPTLPEGLKGAMLAIPKSSVEGDQGKLLRILHIMDAMCYGGDAYFETVQGGGNEVHEGYDGDVREYLEDGTSICALTSDHPGMNGTYSTTNLALAPWQNFGYTLKWQISTPTPDATEAEIAYIDRANAAMMTVAAYDKWPNDNMLSKVAEADLAPNLKEYTLQQQYKFVTGERSMDEWDAFVQEWLDQGGRAIVTAQAEKLGVAVPEEAK